MLQGNDSYTHPGLKSFFMLMSSKWALFDNLFFHSLILHIGIHVATLLEIGRVPLL